jgi:hypothetical protein
MISKTHQAGLAYHAWLNPYRVSSTDYAADSDDNNMSWYDYLNFEHFTDKLEDLGQLAKSSDESYNVLN